MLRLPSPPPELHARIIERIQNDTQDEHARTFDRADRYGARVWLPCATALALLLGLGISFLPKQAQPAVETQASISFPHNPVGEAAATLGVMLQDPLQAEVQNLSQDVRSATRFLLTTFSAPPPVQGS